MSPFIFTDLRHYLGQAFQEPRALYPMYLLFLVEKSDYFSPLCKPLYLPNLGTFRCGFLLSASENADTDLFYSVDCHCQMQTSNLIMDFLFTTPH